MGNYIVSIDQSTQGTKALLFDHRGKLIFRVDKAHQQIVNDKGWVEHCPNEIYNNCLFVIQDLVNKSGIKKEEILGIGISNQRETVVVWDPETQEPIYNAIVWQCARGEKICKGLTDSGMEQLIKLRTGLPLSPYFSAAKIAWILQNVEAAYLKSINKKLCYGTMDSWLVYKLTGGREFKTDYSNASRTQLFNITDLKWDEEVCALFGINPACLPEVEESNADYGSTDFEGFLEKKIPIHAVMGDSHSALFGQGCVHKGMTKATYGTGSSIMTNIGEKPIFQEKGIVTSLAWKMNGKVNYVLEGNINYTGAVVSWLEKDLKIIASAKEVEALAKNANQEDKAYLVPAFSGLGAPYWDSMATGIICGITRTTGQAEIVRAALDSISYQITDVIKAIGYIYGSPIKELRVDGGPTKNSYLMQFQSDMLSIPVLVPAEEELSGMGVAFTAGVEMGLYNIEDIFASRERITYTPSMAHEVKEEKYNGWKHAVNMVLAKKE